MCIVLCTCEDILMASIQCRHICQYEAFGRKRILYEHVGNFLSFWKSVSIEVGQIMISDLKVSFLYNDNAMNFAILFCTCEMTGVECKHDNCGRSRSGNGC